MKKSEMLKILYDAVDDGYYDMIANDVNLVDYILDKCLENGMLPPVTKLSHIDAYDCGWDPE
jgi:hypothetical protein